MTAGTTPRRTGLSAAALYAVLIGGALVVAFPFLWMVLTSFKSVQESNAYPPSLLPEVWRGQNYTDAWFTPPSTLGRYLLNSAVIAIAGTGIQVVIATLAAYAFARLRFPGRNALFLLVLATTMVPDEVRLIPNFMTIRGFPLAGGNDLTGSGGSGFYDTYAGIILPGLAGAFTIFLLRQAFRQVPGDLWEAAQLDGASSLRFLLGVMIPLALPALLTVTIFGLVARWNALLWPLLITRSESLRPVQVAMTFYQTEFVTDHGQMMAASVMVTLPIVVLYVLVQRQFIEGVAGTGIKG
ncbi:MAG: carbohydrate ABC transporter permease [Chloroflexia bacterium]|nr:carbohydrate ABC transporter permease [Chloroflexia bacterium]